MSQKLEICENCRRAIGALETPCVHEGHVVCHECHARLQQTRIPSIVMPVMPPPDAIQPTLPGVRTIEKTGKQWKWHMLCAAGLVMLGVITSCAGCSIFFNGASRNSQATANGGGVTFSIGFLMIAAGLVWGIIARVLAWWHHG